MKVIFKKNILEQILESIEDADRKGEEIEKIELTKAEYRRLQRQHQGILYNPLYPPDCQHIRVQGIPVVEESDR